MTKHIINLYSNFHSCHFFKVLLKFLFGGTGSLSARGLSRVVVHRLSFSRRTESSWGVCMCVVFLQSCPTLCDPMDCSPPGSPVHGVLQAWIRSEFPCPPPEDLPDPGIKPASLISFALAGRFFTTSWTGDQTHVLCIDRCIFNHWTTQEAPLMQFLMNNY